MSGQTMFFVCFAAAIFAVASYSLTKQVEKKSLPGTLGSVINFLFSNVMADKQSRFFCWLVRFSGHDLSLFSMCLHQMKLLCKGLDSQNFISQFTSIGTNEIKEKILIGFIATQCCPVSVTQI